MTRSLALLLVACLAASSFLVGGCKPKAGATCKTETKEICLGGNHALACHDGKWEEMICRGPGGCGKAGNEVVCDQSVAEDKDVCNLVNDFVCSSDKKGMLECIKNKWTFSQSCLGERNCVMESKRVTCDNSLANPGDTCREEDDYACALPDKKNAIVCRGGKFTLASNCRGKNGCNVGGDKDKGFKIECDDSIANPGDTCDKEGHYSCSPDEKQIVRCAAKKYVADEKCKKNEKCAVKGELVGCY
jgi:hypothetical protein